MKKQLKCTPLISEFDKFIRGSSSGRRRKPDGNRISSGTIETYKNCRKILIRFSAKYSEPEVYIGLTINKRIFRDRELCKIQKPLEGLLADTPIFFLPV
jgi:hypothetical protein